MTIHKEGYTSIALTVLFIFVVSALINYYSSNTAWLVRSWHLISFILFIAVLQFFRHPKRKWNIQEGHIISPADGKIVVIEETEETEFFNDRRLQVSIFMSPLNVHVNRNPISGIVKYFKYHPGKHLVAWDPKSSTDNERTTIVLESKEGKQILLRQIAGALVRRIVWYVKEGEQVEQSKELGFIKFGSRVDLFLPIGTEINVKLGQTVKGGISTLAKLN